MKLKHLEIGDSVRSLPDYVFYYQDSLTSVTIGNSVTTIGSQAFYNCSGLASVTIPNAVTTIGQQAFCNCSGLASVTIPNSVTTIGYSAFSGCSGLTSVTIGNSVSSIENSAFFGCSHVDTMYYNARNLTSTGYWNNISYGFGPMKLKHIVIGDSVQSLPDYVFYCQDSLTSVTIGNSVTTIGSLAFYNCSGLASVTIGNSVSTIGSQAFYNCSGLTSVTIGNSVSTIGSQAFYNCSGLTSVTIPNSVTTIGYSAFSGCSGLASVTIPNAVTTIGQQAFYNCSGLASVTIGNSVASIGDDAFFGCSHVDTMYYNARNLTSTGSWGSWSRTSYGFGPMKLKHLEIGDSVRSLPDYVFYHQYGLTSVTIGNSVASIGVDAFFGCSHVDTMYYNARNLTSTGSWGSWSRTSYGFGPMKLKHLEIGDSVRLLPDYVFFYQDSLTNVTIGNSVSTIGSRAFYNCSGLASVTIPNSVTTIGYSAFSGCSGLTSVTIGNSVASIGDDAFYNCSGLTSVTIPNSVTTIGYSAFSGCSGLASVTIGNSVTAIGSQAFYNCSGLASVTIPNSVTTIGYSAFSGCSGLASVTIGNSVSSIENSAFFGCSHVDTMYYNARNLTSTGYWNNISYGFGPMKLKHIVIGDSVQSLPDYVFSLQDSLTSVVIGSSVTSIGSQSFYGCSNISGEITFPSALTRIGSRAFYRCTNISGTINFPDRLEQLGSEAFNSCVNILYLNTNNSSAEITGSAFANCSRLVSVTIGDSTAAIGSSAFEGCFRLSQVSIGNSVATIGANAFKGCVRMLMPNLPEGLTTIGDNAFYGCQYVAGELKFPSTLTRIGNDAFSGCGSISRMTMRSSVPPTISGTTFQGVSTNIPVKVPCGSVLQYYVTDYWENFSNLIEDRPYELTVNSENTLRGTAVVSTYPTCANHAASIRANANYGFHFVRWNDGNVQNPRVITMTKDSAFTAYFAVNSAYITVHSSDTVKGTVTGTGLYSYLGPATVTAIPNAGYHFLRWNDGNTQNPRYLNASQDSVFTAYFVSNVSSITAMSANPEMGTVGGSDVYYYQDVAILSAVPNYGYHFVSWADGDRSNPRNVSVSQDSVFVANFAVNNYNVVVVCNNATMGSVAGRGSYAYNTQIQIQATPNYGYHFVQWSDGNTDNPRVLNVTRDTLFVSQFATNEYVLTVEPNDPAMGSAYGAGTYNYNSEASLSAVPVYGYHFTQWSDGVTDNPRVVAVTSGASYVAQFAINSYIITANSGNPAVGSASGGGTYNYNTPINISATANYGYHFTQWSDGNTDNPRLVTVVNNATYTAQFAINNYAIGVSSNNETMGYVTGSGSYAYNTNAVVSAVPYYGYHFTQWSDGGTDNPRMMTVLRDESITAEFLPNSYNLTTYSNDVTIGSVYGAGTYPYLQVVAVNAVASPHHHFVMWSDFSTANPRNVTITKDTMLSAVFAIDSHQVVLMVNDTIMGHCEGMGKAPFNTSKYLTAVANYGYHFVQWSDGSTSNPRRVTILQDTALTALFSYNQYGLSVSVNDNERGSVAGSGSYNYLSSATMEAVANYGYHFSQWNDGNTDNPRAVRMTKDTSFVARFDLNTYYVDLYANDSSMGSVSGTGAFEYLSQTTIRATAMAHHHFVQWSDGSTSNPRLLTVLADVELTAFFEEDAKYRVSVVSNDSTRGTAMGGGLYYAGDQITLRATANDHYYFSEWSDGNGANPRVVTVVCNVVYTANFVPNPYVVTVTANDLSMGNVSGGGTYEYGTEIAIMATAYPGHRFVRWLDGDANMERTITVLDNCYYQAIFEVENTEGIEDVCSADYSVTTSRLKIVVSQIQGRKMEVFDISGRRIAYIEKSSETESVAVPTKGVYMIQVDGTKPKKVVVM
ncbi:MAG: leucine-rich repeat protein [Bacteroidales bacterium]|nr:leucine-rich repeat protein [Bacteroidales bacterium]